MGGMIAQLMTSLHPDRVASLTSIMSGTLNPRLPGPSSKVTVPLFLSRPKGKSRDALIDRTMELFSLIRTEGDDHGEFRTKIAEGFDRSYYPSGVRRQLAAIIATGDLRPHIRKIKTPALIIHGSKDPLAPVEAGRDSARNIEGSRLEIIEGMAHDLPKKFLPRLSALIVDHARAAEKAAAKLAA
jgi:pimeloyl-ACP methyl ester carboxylesterase